MNEAAYKVKVIKKLRERFPGCEILKVDASFRQGLPDQIILWGSSWAFLEFKKSENASKQANQDHYIDLLDSMSFAAYIFPENEEEVLCALEQAFKPPRGARISKSKSVSLDSLHA